MKHFQRAQVLPIFAVSLIALISLAALPNSRITIPVFMPPLAYDQQRDTVADVKVQAKSVTLGAANPGNMHTLVSVAVAVTNPGNVPSLVHEVRIAAKDADGTTLFTGSATGSYVLPGDTRTFSIAKHVPPSFCARVNSVDIDITTDGAPIHSTAPAQPACAQ
jgi:hypothetical protein